MALMHKIVKNQYFLLFIISLFALGLYFARAVYTQSWFFLFLEWNLFLAWVPLFLSAFLTKSKKKVTFPQILILLVWLLFVPNSLYIITDFIHLWPKYGVPIWFDLIMILSFALAGLLNGFYSINIVQRFLESHIKSKYATHMIIVFVFILSSFGIYLGRFERLNSWDVLLNPTELINSLSQIILDLGILLRAFGVTAVYSLFFIITYYISCALKISPKTNKLPESEKFGIMSEGRKADTR